MNRTEQIRSRFEHFITHELRIHATEISEAQWRSLPLAPVYRFGWMPPVNLQDPVRDDQLIVMFSAELLGAVLELVSDEVGDAYLTTVEAVLAHYVSCRTEPLDDIERQIEQTFFEEAPHALEVRSTVELTALDMGVVPVRQ
jgi:hypothetical protein